MVIEKEEIILVSIMLICFTIMVFSFGSLAGLVNYEPLVHNSVVAEQETCIESCLNNTCENQSEGCIQQNTNSCEQQCTN